jgi:antitoxin (DNA-binding transcriptional repressor) of toxin-antitoxin stability system
METVSIRDLRGADLQERARQGKPLAITNYRVLIGVIIPASSAWVEHLVYYNWSRVNQSIAEGEQDIADVTGNWAGVSGSCDRQDAGQPAKPVVPLTAAVVGETVVQAPKSEEALGRLQALLNPSGSASGQENGLAEPSIVRPIRIGDLSAAQIEKAGVNGQTLAVTYDRELVGILIPVTQGLVQFLLEQNISRVLNNIAQGEEEIKAPGQLTTPD